MTNSELNHLDLATINAAKDHPDAPNHLVSASAPGCHQGSSASGATGWDRATTGEHLSLPDPSEHLTTGSRIGPPSAGPLEHPFRGFAARSGKIG
jgi:hypothetical protein